MGSRSLDHIFSSWKFHTSKSPGTFLPFLYSTPTIQRTWSRSLHTSSRRALPDTRNWDGDEIPFTATDVFEGSSSHDAPSSGKQEIDNTRNVDAVSDNDPSQPASPAYHVRRNTTVTKRERKVFAKLFNLTTSSSQTPPKPPQDAVIPQVPASSDLNSILSKAYSEYKAGPEGSREPRDIMAYFSEDTPGTKEEAIGKMQRKEFRKIERLMQKAKTDMELWEVLESKVFSVIKKLDLAAKNQATGNGLIGPGGVGREVQAAGNGNEPHSSPRKDQNNTHSSEPAALSPTDFSIIGPNYPSLLVTAMRQLRLEFPNSTLPLAILPSIKRLGLESYMLGASTILYNELIAIYWLTYADYQAIDELLQEMDGNGIEFDADTYDLLASIHEEIQRNRVRATNASVVLTAFWKMERNIRGSEGLLRWKDIIRSRLEAEAVRQANAREADAYAELEEEGAEAMEKQAVSKGEAISSGPAVHMIA